MRKQPDVKLAKTINMHWMKGEQPTGTVTWVRKYKLITPLFGGGVSPMECDPVTLIRGSEIRGNLRFWWRATRGGGCVTVEELHQKESAIWGKAAVKGDPVPTHEEILQISVEVLEKGTTVGPKFPPPYVAFPLQQVPNAKLPLNVVFQLTISFPEKWQDDVKAALWAWETFGGIGARTRRGFGALQLLEVNHPEGADFPPKEPSQIAGWIKKRLEHFVAEQNFAANIPHLSPEMPPQVVPPASDPQTVWKNLIRALSEFRQAPDGRDKRSYWPEAETVRRLTNRRDEKKYKPLPHPQKFPRAAFGLPIVFHFKDKYDPKDTSLQGADIDRFASPLILRPLAYSDTRAVGIAMILKGVHPAKQKLVLKELEDKHKEPYPAHAQLTETEAKQLKIPQLSEGQTDVLKAFMDYLKGK